MKQTPAVDGYANHSEYETFVLHHTFDFSPEAHESPSFLIFHRIFIYLLVECLRLGWDAKGGKSRLRLCRDRGHRVLSLSVSLVVHMGCL